MNLSLTDELRDFVNSRTGGGGLSQIYPCAVKIGKRCFF